jgi:hypothetical protein
MSPTNRTEIRMYGARTPQSVYGIGYGLDIQRIGVRFLVGTRDLVLLTMTRWAMEPTHPRIKWMLWLFP